MRIRSIIQGSVCAALVVGFTPAGAVDVPNTFSSGEPAVASEVNQNFSVLADAITSAGSTSFGSEYYISPSSVGDKGSRNVIVLKGQVFDSSGNCAYDVYRVRTYYQNTNSVSVDTPGGSETPARIWTFGYVETDSCGSPTATYLLEYRYALPSSGSFADALGVEINQDSEGDGTFEDSRNFNYFLTRNVNPLATAELVQSTEMYRNGAGETITANNFTSVNAPLGKDLTIGSPLSETFSDVMVQTLGSYSSGDGARIRFRASGIGVVQEINNATNDDPVFNRQSQSNAIYYRVDGTAGGNLAGTPFASGNSAAGIWFSN